MSARPTGETASGSWGTPRVSDANERGDVANHNTPTAGYLGRQVVRPWEWPTPRTTDQMAGRGCVALGSGLYRPSTHLDAGRRVGQANLADAVLGFQVGPRGPASRNTSGRSPEWSTALASMEGGDQRLNQQAKHGTAGMLNHRWVAQLQGFPADWLDGIAVPPSKPSEMRSFRRLPKPSGEPS